MEGLYFGNPEEFMKLLEKKDTISITYYPAVNEFRGKKTLQIMIQGDGPMGGAPILHYFFDAIV